MEPLDLRERAPRAPRAELGGIIFLPRTIDKARAMLPGGHLGLYRMPGFSETMLEQFGIAVDDFVAEVGRANSDDEIATFVGKRATPEALAAWQEFITKRQPRGGDRAAALEVYPFLAERPDLILALDVLAEDDRRLFSSAAGGTP